MVEELTVNENLAYEVFKARRKNDFSQRRYSFALRQFLGEHGEVENHALLNKKVISRKDGTEFRIDKVFLQWYANGYYWKVSCVDKNNNWHSLVISTLNCTDKIILESIGRFNFDYSIQ